MHLSSITWTGVTHTGDMFSERLRSTLDAQPADTVAVPRPGPIFACLAPVSWAVHEAAGDAEQDLGKRRADEHYEGAGDPGVPGQQVHVAVCTVRIVSPTRTTGGPGNRGSGAVSSGGRPPGKAGAVGGLARLSIEALIPARSLSVP